MKSTYRTFASLGQRNFRLYFGGQAISQIGSQVQTLAQSWLILDLTHSAVAVGVLAVCLYGPYAVLGLVGGALGDRLDPRKTSLVTQSAWLVCAALLAGLTFAHAIVEWQVYAISVVRGVVLVVNNPTRQVFLRWMVGRKNFSNAVALNSTVFNAARIVGPGLGGILIAVSGVGVCFAVNAASYLAVIVAILLMRREDFFVPGPAAGAAGTARRDTLVRRILEGLRYARTSPPMLLALGMIGVVSLLAINFQVLLPVLARKTLHAGPGAFGLLSGAFGAGAVLGGVIAASFGRPHWRVLLAGVTGFGAGEILLARADSITTAAAMLALTGICYTVYTATTNALVQLCAPDELQGRVAALYGYVFIGTGPFGGYLAGWLSARGGTELAFFIAGAASLAMAALGILGVARGARLAKRASATETEAPGHQLRRPSRGKR